MEPILSRNPATGATLKQIDQTPVAGIAALVETARYAQKSWAKVPIRERAKCLLNAREYILNNLDDIADLIHLENGKPKFEAIVNDIIPVLDLLSQYAKKAPKLMADKRIPMKLMLHRASYLQFWPKGVIAIISPWNYPFSIPFGEVAFALVAGNAVVFKPSEVTPQIGLKIKEIFDNSGLPKDLLQIVLGDGARGAALVASKIDKVFFTGSVLTGKRVMASAAENLTPVVLELGGKDPMIVLPDADLDYATSAALWGGFSNSGQACASVERILVHESIHDDFVSKLKEKLAALKHGQDLGVATYEKQKATYAEQLAELSSSNAQIVCGGHFSKDRTYLEPTIVTNPKNHTDRPLERTKIYNDETFGPVVAVTTYKTIEEAIEKANHSRYGLLASVIGRDAALAEQVARQIEAGTVVVNDVMYTHGLAETPWGGIKESGFGRVHSDLGFLEVVNVRHIHKAKWWAPLFKAFWWFPYTEHQMKMFRHFANVMFRRSWFDKARELPNLLTEFVEMLKKEKRL